MVISGVFGVVVAYISYKELKYIKTLGTASFGAFIFVKGEASFIGDFPTLFDNLAERDLDGSELEAVATGNISKIHMYYFAEMLLLTCLGTYI